MRFLQANKRAVVIGFVLAVSLGTARGLCGQDLGQDGPAQVRVGINGHYQFFSADGHMLSQLSTPLFVDLVLTRELGFSIRAAQAHSSSDVTATLNGFSDVQLGLVYAPQLAGQAVTAALNVNMPVGRNELTEEEFHTSLSINRQFYGFRMPGLGQGFNLSPSLTWAVTLSPDFAIGAGASYQYRGTFEPLAGMEVPFNPGNEILLTAGVDVRAGPAAAVSADFTLTLFDDDRIGDDVVFEGAHNVHAIIRYKQFFQFDQLQITGVYRSRGRSDAPAAGAGPLEGRTVPNSAEFSVSYGWRINPRLTMGFIGLARVFQRIDQFPNERRYFAAGIAPDFAITPGVRGVTRLSYGLGTVSGGEVGFGIVAGF